MKSHEPKDMLYQVQKNVQVMLSQARQIVKVKHRLPLSSLRTNAIADSSFLSPSKKKGRMYKPQKQQSAFEKKRRRFTKERPLSLMYSNSDKFISETIIPNKFQNGSKQNHQQMKVMVFLNKQQAALIEQYRFSNNSSLKANNPFPLITRKRRGKSQSDESNKCFSISVETIEELKSLRAKKFQTISSTRSSNLLSYLEKNKAKTNPFERKRKQKIKKIIESLDQQFEPWSYESNDNDTIFQF